MVIVATSAMPDEVSPEARDMVSRMRQLMDADLDEYDMADQARTLNAELNIEQDAFDEAWRAMGSYERGAWKRLLVHRRPGG